MTGHGTPGQELWNGVACSCYLTQQRFAEALGISVRTLRNWEQSRRKPAGPALALLRIVARHPRVLLENLAAAT